MKGVFVKALKDADDVQQFGGKAVNLAKMLQASLPVPQGFAVALQAFTPQGKLPDETRHAIQNLLKQNTFYAVRSSAIAEDAEGASWAGQFETFLNVSIEHVIDSIETCHSSAKDRAKAYAIDKENNDFQVAVVVQEMITPAYAGVLFTKDPVTGKDKLVTEYVAGLGESLVSGESDPIRITWSPGESVASPFSLTQLTKLAQKVEALFGVPQDIEWAWAEEKMWLVQARPITAVQKENKGYYLGDPEELFYWGPSRANPLYMSDFVAAVDEFFSQLTNDPHVPNPPKTLILFWDKKMVWLNNAQAFTAFVGEMFERYEQRDKLSEDKKLWEEISKKLPSLHGEPFKKALIQAWKQTLFAEFSLYGAESAIANRLKRFDQKTRQTIWGAFTVPDNGTFLSRIDEELLASKNPEGLANKYPWIEDGYSGVYTDAAAYFVKRLKILQEERSEHEASKKDRDTLAKEFALMANEVHSLTLIRELADFMDERKAWMMQTRKLLLEQIGSVSFGWSFENGKSQTISQNDAKDLWQRYVHFKLSSSAVKGIVASNGGRHFINGEVAIATSPTDSVGNGKILVVPATSPSYVPLMRKAKALVTDHGGMMSHAAIVAREFGLPCIVGTKQATKVLKNGDLVVLDLVKGEVNK